MIKVQNTTQLAGSDNNINNTLFDFYTREPSGCITRSFSVNYAPVEKNKS